MKSLEMEPKSAKRNIEVSSRLISRLATSYRFSLILFISLLQFLSASHSVSVVGDTLGTLEVTAPSSVGKAFCPILLMFYAVLSYPRTTQLNIVQLHLALTL